MAKVIINCGAQFEFNTWIVPAGDWHGEFLGVNDLADQEDGAGIPFIVSVWNHVRRRLEIFERLGDDFNRQDNDLAAQSPGLWLVHALMSLPQEVFPFTARERLAQAVKERLLELSMENSILAREIEKAAGDLAAVAGGEFSVDAVAWKMREHEKVIKRMEEVIGDYGE